MESNQYLDIVTQLLTRIEKTQISAFQEAAKWIKAAIDQGGVLHVFSTGHSHMMVEELFYRAGGLVPVNPIFDPATMLHENATKATLIERLPGYAEVILNSTDTRPGEVIVIISNSGINSVPVEMAQLSRKKGLKVIAITSVSISDHLNSRTAGGYKLKDVANLVIDNCIEESDAAVVIDEHGGRAGAVSTLASAFIAERIVLEVVQEFKKCDQVPPIFMSANIPGGDQHNKDMVEKYKKRVKTL